jgi:zinc transport system substrate-binding protein
MRVFATSIICAMAAAFWSVAAHSASSTAKGGAPLQVVASILPLHSLVAGVMQDVGRPILLVRGGASPHRYAMRPSTAKALNGADMVFWIGPNFESFLVKSIGRIQGASVALTRAEGVRLLPAREGGVWASHSDLHTDSHTDSHTGSGMNSLTGEQADHKSVDQHLWLDPVNARAMVQSIAAALIKADPANSAVYARNSLGMAARLATLATRSERILAPVRHAPYIVFHDAYQYFEKRFRLNVVGSVLVHTGHQPGARRLHDIREKMLKSGAVCIFREPQFEPRLAQSLVRGVPTRIGVLDPLGVGLKPGPEAYFVLLKKLGDAVADCLGKRL